MQRAVNPVDAEVGERQEDRELEPVPGVTEDAQDRVGESRVGGGIVDEAVALDFSDEEGDGEDGHDRDGIEGLLDFHPHLVFEVFRVLEGGLVEDENVAERRKGGVDEGAEEPELGVSIGCARVVCVVGRNSPCDDV